MFVSIITSDMKMDIIIAMKWCQNYHKVLLEIFWEKPRIRLSNDHQEKYLETNAIYRY